MFTRRDNIQKRLVKIKKQEAKTLQTLIKQEDELKKAVNENNELIKLFLNQESSEEKTLRIEIEELTKKMNSFQSFSEKCLKPSLTVSHGSEPKSKALHKG